MSKRSSTYPPDEFDDVDGDGVPAGVHRAPRSRWARAWPYVIVVLGCSLLAVGIVYSVSNSDDTPTATATAAPTSSETTDPDATASDTPAEEAPATETPVEPTEEPTDDATDTSTPVRVLNSTGIAGLAASAASDLEAEGWTDITAATYEGTPVDDSVVYYKTTDDQAEATEVARILGIPTVYEAPSLVGPVSAVLAGDYGQ